MKNTYHKKGFSVVELLISIAIIGLVSYTISTFQKDVFGLNSTFDANLNAQLDARHIVKVMVGELRKTTQSTAGAYPIEAAATSSVTFYSDINNDGLIDKVRYFLIGSTLKKGVIVPTGNPLAYTAPETVTTLINSVVSSSTLPIFQYYPSSYTGTTSPLSLPIDIPSVRLVQINVIIDLDPNRSPVPIIVTSSVSLRNLKDNL